MEKRVLLAVFLSFLVLFVYQAVFVPRSRPDDVERPSGQVSSKKPAGPPATVAPAPPSAGEAPPQPAPPLVGDTVGRDIVVETPEVKAVFSSEGAVVKSWRLKRFLDARGEALELVATRIPPAHPRPFTLRVQEEEIAATLRTALYRPSASHVDATAGPGELMFEYRDTSGLTAAKRFRFNPDGQPYVIAVEASVERSGQPLNTMIEWGPGLGPDLAEAGGWSYAQRAQGIFYRDREVSRLSPAGLAERSVYEGLFGFVGIDDHYFIATAVAPQGNVRVEYRPVVFPPPAGETASRTLVAYTLDTEGAPFNAKIFFGPKEFDALALVDRDLVRAIHFGIFSVIVVPLLHSLKWVNGFVGNYGWAIIILTILINAAMFPLRHKSVVSMRKLQELQPEIKAIQERYAKLKMGDPARQKMNVELMNLYRERGVNPASGCLPMLLTMPVLFAFYALLSVAIEIRGAPFILWIKDLSTHDPLYVTPLLMGGTMVWQQKLTPSTADPTQQKVMMVMPVVFTFMFLWAPSGLVLYWFVSNVWAIGQQVLTNRLIGPPRVRARPSAERRLKRGREEGTETARQV